MTGVPFDSVSMVTASQPDDVYPGGRISQFTVTSLVNQPLWPAVPKSLAVITGGLAGAVAGSSASTPHAISSERTARGVMALTRATPEPSCRASA